MKKILYIIPILLLTIFLKNNVYGAVTNYSTVDDLYNYFDSIGMTYNSQRGVNSHEIVKQSELFIETKASYNYYVIYGGKVVFFNYIPTVPYFRLNDTSNIDIVYLVLRFNVPNVNYAYFCFDMSTGDVTTSLYSNSVGADNYVLAATCDLGYLNDFYTRENFYNLFDSNFDLLYTDTGLPVVQKNPEFSFIPTYSENYESCNLKLDIKNAPDYYTLEYAINSSTATWYSFDNSTGINIQDNCLVIVRMLDENGDEILANSYNIANIIKKPEFNFIPTYSENYETCNLKLDIKNPPDNYGLEYAINSSTSNWYSFDNSTGINVEDNCLVIVRMLDENGDEIFSSSYNVADLSNVLSTTYFKVEFDKSSGTYLAFTPILYNNIYENFDCYFSFSADEEKLVYRDNGNTFVSPLTGDSFMDWTLIEPLHKYYLYVLHGTCNVKLNFKLVNKNTGIIGLERSFEFSLNSMRNPQAISSTTNGIKDPIFDSGANSDLDDNLFASDSLEIDWSMENSKNTIQSFFESTLSFFNLILSFLVLMPAWITVPLNTLFVLTIVIFVFHVIRG